MNHPGPSDCGPSEPGIGGRLPGKLEEEAEFPGSFLELGTWGHPKDASTPLYSGEMTFAVGHGSKGRGHEYHWHHDSVKLPCHVGTLMFRFFFAKTKAAHAGDVVSRGPLGTCCVGWIRKLASGHLA